MNVLNFNNSSYWSIEVTDDLEGPLRRWDNGEVKYYYVYVNSMQYVGIICAQWWDSYKLVSSVCFQQTCCLDIGFRHMFSAHGGAYFGWCKYRVAEERRNSYYIGNLCATIRYRW